MNPSVLMNALVLLTCAVAPQQEQPGREIVREAWLASFGAIRSGIGEGTYQQHFREDGGDWRTHLDARVAVFFNAPKYHIRLEYAKAPLGEDKRVIIYDGTAIFTTRFDERMVVTGGESQVFAGPMRPELPAEPQLAHFHWDVTQLYAPFGHIPRVFDGPSKLEISRLDSGDYMMEGPAVNSNRVRSTWTFSHENGYNVVSKNVFNDGELARITTASWRQDKGIWYISVLFEESFAKPPQRSWRRRLAYETFEVNAEVEPELFTMEALDMPGGSRILDHRPKTPRERVVHYVPIEDQRIEATLDSMVEQLDRMPVTRPSRQASNPPTASEHATMRLWLIGGNIAAVLALLALVAWRHRAGSKRHAASGGAPDSPGGR